MFEIISLLSHQILLMSSFVCSRAKLVIMPEFTPTPWMLEHHSDKVTKADGAAPEPWKVYAWCLRDLMCKHSGLTPFDESISLTDRYSI